MFKTFFLVFKICNYFTLYFYIVNCLALVFVILFVLHKVHSIYLMCNVSNPLTQYPVGWAIEVTGGRRRGRKGVIDRATPSSYWVKFDEPDRNGFTLKRVWKVNVKVLPRQLRQPLDSVHSKLGSNFQRDESAKLGSSFQRDGSAICSGRLDVCLVELLQAQVDNLKQGMAEDRLMMEQLVLKAEIRQREMTNLEELIRRLIVSS
jgi:hypothetical protein